MSRMDNRIRDGGPGCSENSLSTPALFRFPNVYAPPSCAPELPPRPVCRDTPLCEGCPYAGNGFLCRGRDGKCMRSEVARINHFEIQEESNDADTRRYGQK